MIIFCAYAHPNGFFISANQQEDFWMLLSKRVGWGRYSLVRPESEFTENGGLFELCEIRPAGGQAPDQVIESSTVLWHRQEAIEAEKSICSYLQSWQ